MWSGYPSAKKRNYSRKCRARVLSPGVRQGRTRCGELCAYFLQAGSKRINLLLLRVNLATCFEELIEQHGVDLFVSNCLRRTLRVADNQFGIHSIHSQGDTSDDHSQSRIDAN